MANSKSTLLQNLANDYFVQKNTICRKKNIKVMIKADGLLDDRSERSHDSRTRMAKPSVLGRWLELISFELVSNELKIKKQRFKIKKKEFD